MSKCAMLFGHDRSLASTSRSTISRDSAKKCRKCAKLHRSSSLLRTLGGRILVRNRSRAPSPRVGAARVRLGRRDDACRPRRAAGSSRRTGRSGFLPASDTRSRCRGGSRCARCIFAPALVAVAAAPLLRRRGFAAPARADSARGRHRPAARRRRRAPPPVRFPRRSAARAAGRAARAAACRAMHGRCASRGGCRRTRARRRHSTRWRARPARAGARSSGCFGPRPGCRSAAGVSRRGVLHAMRLLARGEPVTSTALEVGYESTSAFIAAFSHVLGTTPGRYYRAQRSRGEHDVAFAALRLRAAPRRPLRSRSSARPACRPSGT